MEESTTKYTGNYVARIDNKIVAYGKSQLEVYRKAKKIHPQKMVSLEYIPTKRETITFL